MVDVIEILVHWYTGRSKNEMASILGVDRKTVRYADHPSMVAPLVGRTDRQGRRNEGWAWTVDVMFGQLRTHGVETHAAGLPHQRRRGGTTYQ